MNKNKNQCPKCQSFSVVVKAYPGGRRWNRCTTTATASGCGFGWSSERGE